MESLTKPELLMLFSILEGELEARDLVIEALKVLIKVILCAKSVSILSSCGQDEFMSVQC